MHPYSKRSSDNAYVLAAVENGGEALVEGSTTANELAQTCNRQVRPDMCTWVFHQIRILAKMVGYKLYNTGM